MYYASFHSIMSYGILGWGGANDTIIKLIQDVQIRLLKIINQNNNTANIMNVRQTFYYFAIMKEIIKLIDLLKLKNINDINSIRKNILRIPKKIQVIGQKCYSFVSIKVFNAFA